MPQDSFERLPGLGNSLPSPGMQKKANEIITLISHTYPWVNPEIVHQVDEKMHELMAETREAAKDIFLEDPFMAMRNFLVDAYLAYCDENDEQPDDEYVQELLLAFTQFDHELEAQDEGLRHHAAATRLPKEMELRLLWDNCHGTESLEGTEAKKLWLQKEIAWLKGIIAEDQDEETRQAHEKFLGRYEMALQRILRSEEQ